MLKNNRPKSNKPKNPHAWVKWWALGSMAGLAVLLNLALQDWIASLHLAVVIVFWLVTLGLGAHALIVAIANRSSRKGEDPGGPGGGRGGPDGPGPADPKGAEPLGHQDDFGLAA